MELELRESGYQTDNGKLKKLTAELRSINDKASNKVGVVRTQQDLVEKESEALEEAMDKVHEAEYRLEKQRKKLEQTLEDLLGGQRESMQECVQGSEEPWSHPRCRSGCHMMQVWSRCGPLAMTCSAHADCKRCQHGLRVSCVDSLQS